MKTTVLLLLLLSAPAIAQDSIPEKKWKFLIEPYLIFPNMSGTMGVRNLPSVNIDASPSDIFGKLKIGGMIYLEAQTTNWAITSDLLFMNLEQDITPTTLINSGKATAGQFMYEAAGLYRFAPFLESGIGMRINTLNGDVNIVRNIVGGTESLSASISQTWVDPIVITRFTADIHDTWIFQFRGDFGGFGIGSNFTWQLQGSVGYQFTRVFSTSLGYRILGADYDKGTGADRFRYDVNTFGPVLRFGFRL